MTDIIDYFDHRNRIEYIIDLLINNTWLAVYNLIFFIFTILSIYFTSMKKERKEGIKKKKDLLLPILSVFTSILLNFTGKISINSFQWFSIFLLYFGLFISMWGLITLKKRFSIFIEAVELIKTGPYKFVKHPIYTGQLLTLLGFVLAINTLSAYIVYIFCIITIVIRAKFEEKKLLKAFPEEQEYFYSTSSFIPFIRIRIRRKDR